MPIFKVLHYVQGELTINADEISLRDDPVPAAVFFTADESCVAIVPLRDVVIIRREAE